MKWFTEKAFMENINLFIILLCIYTEKMKHKGKQFISMLCFKTFFFKKENLNEEKLLRLYLVSDSGSLNRCFG